MAPYFYRRNNICEILPAKSDVVGRHTISYRMMYARVFRLMTLLLLAILLLLLWGSLSQGFRFGILTVLELVFGVLNADKFPFRPELICMNRAVVGAICFSATPPNCSRISHIHPHLHTFTHRHTHAFKHTHMQTHVHNTRTTITHVHRTRVGCTFVVVFIQWWNQAPRAASVSPNLRARASNNVAHRRSRRLARCLTLAAWILGDYCSPLLCASFSTLFRGAYIPSARVVLAWEFAQQYSENLRRWILLMK